MAMTGGTAHLVRSVNANYGNASWKINLYVYVKEYSQDVANNTTTLHLGMYVSTPSGYDIGPWDYSTDSYVGTATSGANYKPFNGAISNFSGTKWLVENQAVTVSHEADGSKTVTIYWKWGVNSPWGQYQNPSGSFSVKLTDIPRATTPTLSASSVYMGSALTVNMPRASSAFTHKLTYIYGDEAEKPLADDLGTSKSWTVPYDIANEIPNATSIQVTLKCYTYKNSTQSGANHIGTKSVAFTAKVPNNTTTRPVISDIALESVHDLSDTFDGLYIQGKSKVKATITAEGKYGAAISSYKTTIDGVEKTGSKPTSDILAHAGTVNVSCTVTDTRGYSATLRKTVTVIEYTKPVLIPFTGDSDIVCDRCTSDGTISKAGTYLRIRAGRRYSPVMAGDVQKNFCLFRYRYKLDGESSYSSWKTFIARDNTDYDVDDDWFGNIVSNITLSYNVQLSVLDDIGGHSYITFLVSTDDSTFHLIEGGGGAAFGKYAEEKNVLDIAQDWKLKVRSGIIALGDAEIVSGITETGTLELTGTNPDTGLAVAGTPTGALYYKKFADGTYEVWGNITVTPTNSSQNAAGFYYSEQVLIPVPFEMESAIVGGSVSNWAIISAGGKSNTDDHKLLGLRLIRFSEISGEFSIRLQANGKLK